jgi:hypothetical protein
MVISSLYFVEHLCQFRILPLTARASHPHRAFDLALRSSLSLEPLVAGQVASRLLDLAFGLSIIPPVVCFLSVHDTPPSLRPQNLFDLTDLSLNFAGYLFTGAFGFQLRIIAEFPGDLLDFTLHFVKRSFRLVPNARFHDVPPIGFRFDYWAGIPSPSLWRDPIREAIVWDSSLLFSSRTFIRMMTRIMQSYLQMDCQQRGKAGIWNHPLITAA